MKNLSILFCLFISACGGLLLEEGKYNVTITTNMSTDPFVEAGRVFEAEWTVSHKEDSTYGLLINSETEISGADVNDEAHFLLEEKDQINDICHISTVITAVLKPTAKGLAGEGFVGTTLCSMYNPNTGEVKFADWNLEYSFEGTLK